MRNYNKITPELVADVTNMIKTNTPESIIRRFIRDSLKLGKSRGNEIFNTIKYNITDSFTTQKSSSDKSKSDTPLETNSKYTFNSKDKNYIVYIKSAGKNIVIPEHIHKGIMAAYVSNLPVDQISVKFGIPVGYINEYKTIFGWRRDGVAITDEDAVNLSVDACAGKLLEEKKFEIIQEFNKLSWRRTMENAKNWELLKCGTLDVAKLILSKWVPSKLSNVKPTQSIGGDYTFIVGANDWHIGEIYKKSSGVHGKDFNSEIAVSLIDKYSDKIDESIAARKYKFSNCICVLNGDILNSCFNGETVKGTVLHNDKINEEMFKIALDTISRFIERLVITFPKVSVHILPGNHDGPLLSILGFALEAYFKKVPSVNFNISKAWAEIIRVRDVGILITHGGSAFVKSSLPQSSLKLKSYLQDIWSSKADQLAGCKQKIVISGHFHRFWHQDMGYFDFYCFGGLPLGDSYSDSLNLTSTPRQNCLILNESHVIESLHYYL